MKWIIVYLCVSSSPFHRQTNDMCEVPDTSFNTKEACNIIRDKLSEPQYNAPGTPHACIKDSLDGVHYDK